MVGSPVGKGSKKQPTIRPTEYRCFIKEVNPLWRSGCENPIVEKFPSSSGQLPVPMALNARLSTLFAHTIHHVTGKVKGKWEKMDVDIWA